MTTDPADLAAKGTQRLDGRRLAALALLGAWALMFGPALVMDVAPYYRDHLHTMLPVRDYLHRRLWAGELPRWYPYEALGVPFIGQIVTATFHPQTLLFLPFAPVVALKLNTLLAYLLAEVGMYRVCRELGVGRVAAVLGGVAFAFGGYALGVSHNLVYLMGDATLPWVLWAALRVARVGRPRHVAALGVSWALVFLAGDAQFFALSPLLLLVALVLTRSSLAAIGRMAAAGGIAVLLVCVELLPAFALSRDSVRSVGQPGPMFWRTFSLHPLRLVELAVPGPIPDALRMQVAGPLFQDGGGLWATTIFAGVTVLLLAGVGLGADRRKGWVFGGLVVLGLWLATGGHGGLLPLLCKVVPPLRPFRFPEKYAALAWLGLCPLAALGLERWRVTQPGRGVLVAVGVALGLLILGLAVGPLGAVEAVFSWRGHPLPSSGEVATAVEEAWRRGLLTSAAFAGLLALLGFAARRQPRLLVVIPGVVLAELANANASHLPMVDRAMLETPTAFTDLLHAQERAGEPPHRVIPLAGGRLLPLTVSGSDPRWVVVARHLLLADEAGRWGVGTISMNLPATSRRAALLLGPTGQNRGRWGSLFDGCYRVTDAGQPLVPGERMLLEDHELLINLSSVPCQPRAWLAASQPVSTEFQALDRFQKGLPPSTVVWEAGPALPGGPGQVRWLQDAPEHLSLEVEASAPSALVVSDELAPGWEATVDGTPAPLYFTQVATRGLAMQPGTHRVEMRYHTPGLGLGALLSGLGLVLAGALAFWPLRRRAA